MTEKSRHSIKVPRLFKSAAKIAQVVREEGGSLKELVYNGNHPNIKALYALVVQTLQHEKQLNRILEHSKLLQQETRLDPWLARVLITELLWGKKRLAGESKPVQTILSYQSSFNVDTEGDDDAGDVSKDNEKVVLPRYVRVNTLYWTVEQAVEYFRNEGWILARKGDETLFPTSEHFRSDQHVPELLVFPPGTELYQHPLYKDRSILLQDKASCLAAHLLSPHNGSVVLDMCAAPGMKTTHLAAVMNNRGTIYAVEKDPKRYTTLCKFVEEAGATCVKSLQEDSIQLNAESVPNVEYIMVDPSCSGSGMVARPSFICGRHESWNGDDSIRTRKLVGFQKRLLTHALTSFPKACKVLYSTCSLLPAENEEVVSWALNEYEKRAMSPITKWKLVEDPLPGWVNRGCEKTYPGIGKHCLYARTETDLTNGFFLAIFERDVAKGGEPDSGKSVDAQNGDIRKKKKKGKTDLKGKHQKGDQSEGLGSERLRSEEESSELDGRKTEKKKKEKKRGEEVEEEEEASAVQTEEVPPKQKKKRKAEAMEGEGEESSAVQVDDVSPRKKKKRRKNLE